VTILVSTSGTTSTLSVAGAFVVVANGYDAFAEAFRQKLTLEVGGLVPDRKPAIALIRRRMARTPPD
jgi:hypothetical protein